MIRKSTRNIILYLMLFLCACGYKVVDKSQLNNFTLADIKTSGDNRVNFKLKSLLSINSKLDGKNLIDLELETKKIKEIKEKNIKNEITKYQITIKVNARFNPIDSEKVYKTNASSRGDYLVADNHSTTIQNEKKLVENLVEEISKELKNKISSIINDI